MSDIPEKLRELVNAELRDGETIQWIDMPIPYYFTVGSAITFGIGIYFILWSLAATSFVLSSLIRDIPGHAVPKEFILIGVIILLIGLYLLSAPLRVRKRTQRTVYVLTNHRAIIVQETSSALDVTSYYPANLWHLSRKQKADGTGSLCFNTTGGGILQWTIRRGFLNIRNVEKVERMMQDLKAAKLPEQ
jgi:hypothetical protein